MSRYLTISLMAILLMGLIFGCTTTPISVVDNEDFELINNESYLYNSEIEEVGEEIEFSTEKSLKAKTKVFFKMFKVARVKAPKHEGETLQATDIAIAGDAKTAYAYVSYAMAGDVCHGGIDILELKKGYFPKIKSRLLTKNEDVYAATYDPGNNYIYLGLQIDYDVYYYESPEYYRGAFFRAIELNSNYKVKTASGNIVTYEMPLNSWAANDAAIADNFILVPVGDKFGGVEVLKLSQSGIERETFISNIPDTRAVAATPDLPDTDFIVYRGYADENSQDHTPQIIKYRYNNVDFEVVGTIKIENPIPQTIYSKSSLEVHGDVAFLAASDGGVYVVDLVNNSIILNIPNPTPTGSLTEDKVTANAVTVGTPYGSSRSVIFIANGEYGVRAFALDFDIESTTSIAAQFSGYDPDSNYLGYISFGNGNSANSVLLRNGYLYVGTGLGGVNVIYVFDSQLPIQKFKKPSLYTK